MLRISILLSSENISSSDNGRQCNGIIFTCACLHVLLMYGVDINIAELQNSSLMYQVNISRNYSWDELDLTMFVTKRLKLGRKHFHRRLKQIRLERTVRFIFHPRFGISTLKLQQFLRDNYTKQCSPKTTWNFWSFICHVFQFPHHTESSILTVIEAISMWKIVRINSDSQEQVGFIVPFCEIFGWNQQLCCCYPLSVTFSPRAWILSLRDEILIFKQDI